jgi:hypothetical protein
MACSSGDFFGIGSRRDPQAHRCVPEVMHANIIESGRLDSWQPEPKAEVSRILADKAYFRAAPTSEFA